MGRWKRVDMDQTMVRREHGRQRGVRCNVCAFSHFASLRQIVKLTGECCERDGGICEPAKLLYPSSAAERLLT